MGALYSGPGDDWSPDEPPSIGLFLMDDLMGGVFDIIESLGK